MASHTNCQYNLCNLIRTLPCQPTATYLCIYYEHIVCVYVLWIYPTTTTILEHIFIDDYYRLTTQQLPGTWPDRNEHTSTHIHTLTVKLKTTLVQFPSQSKKMIWIYRIINWLLIILKSLPPSSIPSSNADSVTLHNAMMPS